MKKKDVTKYWENETPETIEFGNNFMRCYDAAGKLQFGTKVRDRATGEWVYAVKFVLDRNALFTSEEAPGYLRQLVEDWEEMVEEHGDAD